VGETRKIQNGLMRLQTFSIKTVIRRNLR